MTQTIQGCKMCRIGRCQPIKAPYMYWVHNQVMVMPDSPAFACDVCGQVQYAPAFLVRIERLLQELESSMEAWQAAQVPAKMDEAIRWQPTNSCR